MESLNDFSDEFIDECALENLTLARLMKYYHCHGYECVNTNIIFNFDDESYMSAYYFLHFEIRCNMFDEPDFRRIIEDIKYGNIHKFLNPPMHHGIALPYPYNKADDAKHYELLSKYPVVKEFMKAAKLLLKLYWEDKSVYEFGRMLKDAQLSEFWICIINPNMFLYHKDGLELPEVDDCYNEQHEVFERFYQTGDQPPREHFISFFEQEKYVEHWKEKYPYVSTKFIASKCVDLLSYKYLNPSAHISYVLKTHDKAIKDISQRLSELSRSFDGIELAPIDKAVMIRRRIPELSSHVSNERLTEYIKTCGY